MKNYQNSDYALNKHRKGIVYRFADEIVEVTLEAYLAENPDKTEAEFLALKELSDADYLEGDRAEYNQTRKNVSLRCEEDSGSESVTLEERHLDALDKLAAAKAFDVLLAAKELSETQQRRFLLYVVGGLSLRQIAECEGVTFRAVAKSVNAGTDMLKKYFAKFL